MATAGTTHHVVLDDGTTQIGLIASDGRGNPTFSGWHREPLARNSFKTATGEQKYSDLEPPYYTVAQDDWKGGRGQEKFDDKTKFYDSKSLWTHTKNQCILGPRQLSTNVADSAGAVISVPGEGESLNYQTVTDDIVWGQEFTTDSNGLTVTEVRVILASLVSAQSEGTPANGSIKVGIYADDGGSPNLPTGAVIVSDTMDYADLSGDWEWFPFNMATALSASTTYWVVVEPSDTANWKEIGIQTATIASGEATAKTASRNPNTWSAQLTVKMFYQVLGEPTHPIKKFARPWDGGALYAITNPAVGTAGKLYINGDQGACDSNAAAKGTLIDASKTGAAAWTSNEWGGCVVRIIDGPGEGEWRTIVSNTATVLTVDDDWDITHTTASSYAILGSNKWTEITPTGTVLTDTCTDIVKSGNDYLLIAQGDGDYLLRVRVRNNAGTWETTGAAVGSFNADLLCRHATGQTARVYRAYDNGGTETISWCSDEGTWTFNTGVAVHLPITALVIYNNTPYVFTADRLFAVVEDKLQQIDIDFTSMADMHNGVNASVYNMFLMFPLGYGLERLSGSTVDDIGPNRDAGLPDGRQGVISCMAPVVDCLYAGIDAGIVDTSSVLAYNNFGWHELLRCAGQGDRLGALQYQVIPGGPNILWYGEGGAINYVLLPSKTSNPYLASGMNYALNGELITSWIDIGLVNANKFWHELTVNAENLDADTYITCYYQTDTDTDSDSWTLIGSSITSSGATTQSITTDDSLAGKRIRFKFVLASNIATATPRLVAWSLEAVARMQSKFSYALPVKIFDEQLLLDRTKESDTAVTIMAKLNEWADGLEEKGTVPLTMTTMDPCATNKKVFVEAMEYRLSQLATDAQGTVQVYSGTFRAIEA